MRADEESNKQAGRGFQRTDCHRGLRFSELGGVEPGLRDRLTAFMWGVCDHWHDRAWPVTGPQETALFILMEKAFTY